ncbi:hypothetical protein GYH30_016155 [Glycine max]|uniref:Damage-control phosphatase ARMT1-like metal-binding domain-containing protein n=1 Tax=Glycine max TaxID=3847 RepID=K7KX52_SOYBN|nr:hypothetical protein GYH30_016155 [Glycine max]
MTADGKVPKTRPQWLELKDYVFAGAIFMYKRSQTYSSYCRDHQGRTFKCLKVLVLLMEMNYMLAYGSGEASLRLLWNSGSLHILLPFEVDIDFAFNFIAIYATTIPLSPLLYFVSHIHEINIIVMPSVNITGRDDQQMRDRERMSQRVFLRNESFCGKLYRWQLEYWYLAVTSGNGNCWTEIFFFPHTMEKWPKWLRATAGLFLTNLPENPNLLLRVGMKTWIFFIFIFYLNGLAKGLVQDRNQWCLLIYFMSSLDLYYPHNVLILDHLNFLFRENEASLVVLPDLLMELDSMDEETTLLTLIEGVLAANIFYWGSRACVDLYHKGTIIEIYKMSRNKMQRPWQVDDFDAFKQRMLGTGDKKPPPHRRALLFVDNASADTIWILLCDKSYLLNIIMLIVNINKLPDKSNYVYSYYKKKKLIYIGAYDSNDVVGHAFNGGGCGCNDIIKVSSKPYLKSVCFNIVADVDNVFEGEASTTTVTSVPSPESRPSKTVLSDRRRLMFFDAAKTHVSSFDC